ncbi:hypothetical protein [Campylobacter sp. RM9328]|uniref:hypothetical protein n=1 Tax=Campylobacter sp. RM9328 TaxID=1705720 RepID=UPI00147422FF|nr:hypothetical protein [Campylobacter sp. RM9328]
MPRITIQASKNNLKKIKDFIDKLEGKIVISKKDEVQSSLNKQREYNKRLRARIKEAYNYISREMNAHGLSK